MTAQPAGSEPAFSSPFSGALGQASAPFSYGQPRQYFPSESNTSVDTYQVNSTSHTASRPPVFAPSSSSSAVPTPITRKRRAASPTVEAKRRRPNLAHGFSGLSISPEMRKDGVGEQAGEEVDDDDALLPHERELVIEELGDDTGGSGVRLGQESWQAPNHIANPNQRRPKHPPRQFSASNPTFYVHRGRQHGPTTARPRAGYADSSSASEASDAEGDAEYSNTASASQSPYMSRRPTIHADEVELPDVGEDGARGMGGMHGAEGVYRDGPYDGVDRQFDTPAGGVDDVEVEELPSPEKSKPFTFNFSHSPHLPQPSIHATHATSNRGRGVKRRTSSVSSEGDARQKKSKGLEGDDDMEIEMEPGTDGIRQDTEIRGRSRARETKRGNGWYEPEKDRIIYTSLSSPSPSRSRSRSRSTSPPIEISTSDLSALPDLSQPGQQGFTISPSMLTRLLAAQRDNQARGRGRGDGRGGNLPSSSSSSSFPTKIRIDGHDFPFDPSLLTPENMRGMNERGLVLYRPLGILPGLNGGLPQVRVREHDGERDEGGRDVSWQDTVKRWAEGQKVPLSGPGTGMEVEMEGEEEGRGRFEEITDAPDAQVGEQYGPRQDATMQSSENGFLGSHSVWQTQTYQPPDTDAPGPQAFSADADGDIEME